ncbi:MAG: hypothetical protein E6Z15_09570 [Paenibacillus macerans]|nr:hypothetical protein [Paenibacillus macerans]
MSRREIENDDVFRKAEYEKFKLAAELDDPLKYTPEERKKKMAIYDRTCELIERYRRGRLVQKYPGLREQYRILGWEFQEFEGEYDPEHDFLETDPPPATPPPETAPAAAKPPASKPVAAPPDTGKKIDIGAWLDDD